MIQHSNDILHNLLSWGTRPKKASAPPPVLIRMSRCLVATLIPVLPRCHPSCLAAAYGYLFILSLHTPHAILALKPPCVVPATPCLPQYDHLFPFLFYPPPPSFSASNFRLRDLFLRTVLVRSIRLLLFLLLRQLWFFGFFCNYSLLFLCCFSTACCLFEALSWAYAWLQPRRL